MIRLDTSHPDGTHGWAFPPTAPTLYLLSHSSPPHLTQLLSPTGEILRTFPSPLDGLSFLTDHLATLPPPPPNHLPARWIGYLNYDLAHLFESLPRTAVNDLPLPLYLFALCPSPPVFPSVPPCLGRSSDRPPASVPSSTSTLPRPAFEAAVSRALDYIRAGDIFQVNLAQRLSLPLRSTPADIYSRLLAHSPAHYGAHLSFPPLATYPPFHLLSNSPELFLRLDSPPAPPHVPRPLSTSAPANQLPTTNYQQPTTPPRTLTTRPIKGTRPLLLGMDLELENSEKDRAELAMIVDLLRNDLGRICTFGSVKVTRPRDIEPHPTVYHAVSTITGYLRPNVTFPDLLRATFPCGSITGAPKIRAMQIIDELEPTTRNAYCGAIGYLCQSGQLQFNVAIRTLTTLDNLAHLSVGSGIVADSTPPSEYEETLTKARALLSAL